MKSKQGRWALFYLENLNWSVIPINPKNKIPLIKWKPYSKRLPTVAEITEWWTKHPNANIGLCTGEVSKVLVIDIDEHEIGGTEEYLKHIYTDKSPSDPFPPWEHTVTSRTARGGYHWFFLYGPGLVSRRVIPAVDLKTTGGYVVIPPSNINGSAYEWIKAPYTKTGAYYPSGLPTVYRSLFDKANPSLPIGSSAVLSGYNSVQYIKYIENIDNTPYTPYIHSIKNELPMGDSREAAALLARDLQRDRSVTPNFPDPIGVLRDNSVTRSVTGRVQNVTLRDRDVNFNQGSRDESLFHVGNSLVRGGMHRDNVRYTLGRLAEICQPPFPAQELEAKVISALERGDHRVSILSNEILAWIYETDGYFSYHQLDSDLKINTKQAKANRRKIVQRLKEQEIIEGMPGKSGMYRRRMTHAEGIDFTNTEVSAHYENFKLPFGEHELVYVLPKQVILVSGVFDSGKTSYLLNVVHDNQKDFPINYFSSEMGPMEFRSRLELFPNQGIDDWTFNAYERSEDFQDVIKPDEVNIIDFLELHDNFYQVGGLIKRIWDKLDNGLAIIGIQKNPGVLYPLGGSRAMEKARLVVALDYEDKTHKITITKGKNWRSAWNPRGLWRTYWINDGCQFTIHDPWQTPEYREDK